MLELTKSYICNNEDPTIKETTYVKQFLEINEKNKDKLLFTYYFHEDDRGSIKFTCGDLISIVNNITTGLYKKIGLKKGDVIAVYLPNCLPYVILDAAIHSSGLIMFPLNPAFTSNQLKKFCQKAKPNLIVTTSSLLQNIRDFSTELKALLVDFTADDISNNNYSFEILCNTKPDIEYITNIRNQIQPNDLLYYACTSGSTGDPKICTYTNKQFTVNNSGIMKVSSILPYDERRELLFVPYFTTNGHIILSIMFLEGLYLILTDKFDPEKIFQLIEKEKATGLSGTPSAFLALMHHPSKEKYDLSSFKEIIVGGAAASNEFLESLMKIFHLKFAASAFGMTEGCGVIYIMPARVTGIPASPLQHFEVRVVHRKTREIVDVGIPGELEIKSEIMMKEYLNNDEANKEAFTYDKWFKTGDEVIMDKNGFLTITGRIKEMIIRGGHNIWPNEIVDAIIQYPKIQEAAVIGIPDKFQGESVAAFVVIKPGCKFNNLENELRNFLKYKLVPYSIPIYYFEVPNLPKNSSHKVYLPKLKEMANDLIQERFKKLEESNNDKPITDQGKELAKLWSKWFDIPVKAISRSSNFFTLGGNSLVGVQTIGFLKKYNKSIPFNFLDTYQTLGQIEDYLKDPEGSIKVNIQLIKDFYELKFKTASEIFGEINCIKNKCRKSVAVTGATGYLGIYIVNELNKHSEIDKIYCIGRSINKAELKLKMLTKMKKVNLELNKKIEFVVGDVSKKDFGIESKTLEIIKKECKVLIHCAAIVNWNKTYNQLKECNVTGVINAMKIAGKEMNFVYISSFGVALKKNETLNNIMPMKAFGYIQSKWLSEHYSKKGREIGISSTIIRPCYITADTQTGICNTDDFIYKFIRQCVINKIAPSNVLLDLTPVDKVAKGIVDNMMAYNKIINLIPAKQTSTDLLFKIYNEKFNGKIQMLNKEKWIEKYLNIAKRNEEALSIVPSLVVIDKNYKFTTDYLNGKNDFLNFEESDIIANFKKFDECGFFTKKEGYNLFGRTN